MSRLIRSLSDNAINRSCKNLLELLNLLRRGAEPR
jgi:hypothetical protein